MSFITLAAATLPSLPLDFAANKANILESIHLAKQAGARVRVGPELEIPGYGCLDHHLESDTFLHAWEVLADIINDSVCQDMLISLGMGVRHRNVRYNAQVVCTYKRVILIRPKMALANDGLYREARHFTPWPEKKHRQTEIYYLEHAVSQVTGQRTVPIGDAIISTLDTALTCETCEELFTPLNPSSFAGLNGCEIFLNSSASHAELRKIQSRLDLIVNSTRKLGGVYVYANATGVDGEARMMFDGSSMVISNGRVLAQGSQFSLKQVEVTVATVDIEEVRSFRSAHSRNVQGASQPEYPRVECEMLLSRSADELWHTNINKTPPMQLTIHDPMMEIHLSTAVFLWQYLCRTNSPGFFLALSGGLDSSTTALFVYGMAKLVIQSIKDGEERTLDDLRRVTGEKSFEPKKPEEIVRKLLHSCYMGTVNSSTETRSRSKRLAERLGAYHSDTDIDKIVDGFQAYSEEYMDFAPRYITEGGSPAENLAK